LTLGRRRIVLRDERQVRFCHKRQESETAKKPTIPLRAVRRSRMIFEGKTVEAIIFVGLQASGKSTFYRKHFFRSHLRISNDLLKTRNRERLLLNFCKETTMSFVIDNTNHSVESRRRYIEFTKAIGCPIHCYYFKTDLARCLEWNRQRQGEERIPDLGILGTHRKLEIPSREEGFDALYYVDLVGGNLVAMDWLDEI
jgi:predicted kinase